MSPKIEENDMKTANHTKRTTTGWAPRGTDQRQADDLALEARRGDAGAENRLFTLLLPYLFLVAYGVVRNYHDALDVAQEAGLSLHRSLAEDFDPAKGSLQAFARRIAINAGISCLRKRDRHPSTGLECAGGGGEDPVSEVLRQEDRELVRRAVAELGGAGREALSLVSLAGLTYKEAGKLLGKPAGTLAREVHEAKRALRVRLAPAFAICGS
jgi:RNA polymerase sigma-70 factor, ECF subfamily